MICNKTQDFLFSKPQIAEWRTLRNGRFLYIFQTNAPFYTVFPCCTLATLGLLPLVVSRQKPKPVQSAEVKRDDFVNDVLDSRLVLVAELVTVSLNFSQLVLQKLDDIAGLLSRH